MKNKLAKTGPPLTGLGVDLGGTRIKIGLVDEGGHLLIMKKFPTKVHLGREALIRRILQLVGTFLKDPLCLENPPRVIGLGAAGMIDIRNGVVEVSPNFPDWRRVPLGRKMKEVHGLATYLDNDANVVTYGEKWAGAGRDLKNFACLTLGTGVGGGLVLDGRLWYGSHGSGPEIGHMTIRPNGDRCLCGNRGCLETLASATWLVKKALRIKKKQSVEKNPRSGFLSQAGSFDAKDLLNWAQQGDRDCLRLYRQLGESLGIAIANLVHILSLEGIILGGGVSRAGTIFLPYLEKEFKKRLTLIPPEKIHIRISELQEKSGVLGAAGIALERAKEEN